MKKNFLKSVGAAVVGISLTAACSMLGSKEEHKCASSKCSSQKTENHNCSTKKNESNNCSTKKAK